MTPDTLRTLATSLLAASERATKRPWHAVEPQELVLNGNALQVPPHVVWVRDDEQGRRCSSFVAKCDGCGCENNSDATFIAESRTTAPLLARAVLELLPYVRHKRSCIGNDPSLDPSPCDCGLSSALAGLGER